DELDLSVDGEALSTLPHRQVRATPGAHPPFQHAGAASGSRKRGSRDGRPDARAAHHEELLVLGYLGEPHLELIDGNVARTLDVLPFELEHASDVEDERRRDSRAKCLQVAWRDRRRFGLAEVVADNRRHA